MGITYYRSAQIPWTADLTGPTGPATSGITGKCLDVSGGQSVNFQPVDLNSRNGTGAQQWRWSSNGIYGESLTNPQSGLCLDDPAATTTNGTQLQIYTCNGTLAQVWRLP